MTIFGSRAIGGNKLFLFLIDSRGLIVAGLGNSINSQAFQLQFLLNQQLGRPTILPNNGTGVDTMINPNGQIRIRIGHNSLGPQQPGDISNTIGRMIKSPWVSPDQAFIAQIQRDMILEMFKPEEEPKKKSSS